MTEVEYRCEDCGREFRKTITAAWHEDQTSHTTTELDLKQKGGGN